MQAPDAVRDRGGPDQDAGQREHRRVGRRPHASRADRHFRVDAYPTEQFAGTVRAGAPEPDDGAERRHLFDRHRRAEPGAEAEAGHDGEREHRDRAPGERAARAERGAALPSDARTRSWRSTRRCTPGHRARPRRRARRLRARSTERPGRSARPGPAIERHADGGVGGDDPGDRGARQQPDRRSAAAIDLAIGRHRRARRPMRPRRTAAAARSSVAEATSAPEARSMDPEERRRRIQERLAQMTPEERAAFEQRMRERQAQGLGGGQGDSGKADGASPRGQQAAASNPRSVTTTNASTIDSLFGPLPSVESRGRTWLYINKQLKPVNLRLGHFRRHVYGDSQRERDSAGNRGGHERHDRDRDDATAGRQRDEQSASPAAGTARRRPKRPVEEANEHCA